jgi:hypothetical protein
MRLTTIAEYEAFVYGLRDAFSSVLSSTLRIIRTGPASGRLVGILTFSDHLRLDVAELVDFDAGQLEILQYGYVVWQDDERCIGTIPKPIPMTPCWQPPIRTTSTFLPTSSITASLRPNSRSPGLTCRS